MTPLAIPLDSIGYSVSDGNIHTRYAGHGNGQRTRTAKGVENLLGQTKGKVCADCYPSPQYASTARSSEPQKRRTGPKVKNPTQDEQDEAMGRHQARGYGVPE